MNAIPNPVPSFTCRFARLLPLVLLTWLGLTASAVAQTTINSTPYTISASGHYVLGTNLNNSSTTVPAITINVANVILDLNGYYVSGAHNTASTNAVISVGDVANVTIKNGTVANDGYGIYFGATSVDNSRNYVVDSVAVTRCYLSGVYFANDVGAPGSVVRNSSFSNTGNSTNNQPGFANAIYTSGGVRIENNTIANVTATNGYGINALDGDFSIGNTISNCPVGIAGGTYLNNLTSGCATPFLGGTNATGNT